MARLYGAVMDRVVPAVLAGGATGAAGRWAIGEFGWSSARPCWRSTPSAVSCWESSLRPFPSASIRSAWPWGSVCAVAYDLLGLAVDLAGDSTQAMSAKQRRWGCSASGSA